MLVQQKRNYANWIGKLYVRIIIQVAIDGALLEIGYVVKLCFQVIAVVDFLCVTFDLLSCQIIVKLETTKNR